MHFKHPEILYFLFLLLIPILVHLFQLRRFRKEYFTNVRFLQQLSVQTRKSSQLKKWLLLATRCLLLAAVVFAFAQPFFEAKEKNTSTNELFILLDNSYSMQAKGQKGELMRRAVEDLLAHTPEDQSFSLLTNTDDYWNTDIRSIRRDLQQLHYSALPFSLEAMMARVKAHHSPYKKDILVITDGHGITKRDLESIDKNANTYFIVPEAEQKKQCIGRQRLRHAGARQLLRD
ncbi:BatA and WFA domain-containing protein [Flavobacterium sp. N1718]|uniref:BatA and WFA domain-containing protein n=1 Tax=Flavobacterium sp. N1718 TaxID=2986822 RepID=UPI0029CABC6A|nr:BatA and WFA domain-containing protein [Flavobacterium sp. N1718]